MFTPYTFLQTANSPSLLSQVGNFYTKNPQLSHSILRAGKNMIFNPITNSYYDRGGDDDYEYYHKPYHPKPVPPPPPNGGLFGMGALTSFVLGGIAGYALTQINQPNAYQPPPSPYQPLPYQPIPYPSSPYQPIPYQASMQTVPLQVPPKSINQSVNSVNLTQPQMTSMNMMPQFNNSLLPPSQNQVTYPLQQTQMMQVGYQAQPGLPQMVPRPVSYYNGYPYPYYDTMH